MDGAPVYTFSGHHYFVNREGNECLEPSLQGVGILAHPIIISATALHKVLSSTAIAVKEGALCEARGISYYCSGLLSFFFPKNFGT